MATFSDLITHTRASTATYVDSSGNLQTAASGVPRVGHHIYDGSQWVNEGILHESEARTNLLTYSEQFDNAAWGKSNVTVTANATTAPNGTLSADKLIAANGATGLIFLFEQVTVTGDHEVSLFAKAAEFPAFWISSQSSSVEQTKFDLENGVVLVGNGNIESVGSGWYRCSTNLLGNGSSENIRFILSPTLDSGYWSGTGDGTSGIYIWGAQLEAGSTPSSYIPTTGSQVTRAADSMTIPAAKLPYDATNMSIAMEGRMTYADEGAIDMAIFFNWYANVSNRITAKLDTDLGVGQLSVFQSDAGVIDLVDSAVNYYSPGINVPFSIASRHGSTFINGAVDGTALTANTTPTALPDLSTTELDLGQKFMGTIRQFRMWNDDLGDTGIAEASS